MIVFLSTTIETDGDKGRVYHIITILLSAHVRICNNNTKIIMDE